MPAPEWTIANAKSKLSEVLNLAEQEVQIITRRNRQYFVLSGEAYQKLAGSAPSLKDLVLEGPSLEGVDLDRDKSRDREVSL